MFPSHLPSKAGAAHASHGYGGSRGTATAAAAAAAASQLRHLHGTHAALRGAPRGRRLRARLLPRVPRGLRPRQGRVRRRRRHRGGAPTRRAAARSIRSCAAGRSRGRVRAVVRGALRGHVPQRAADVLPVPGLLRDDGGRRRVLRGGVRDAVGVPGVQAAVLRAVRRAVARRRELRRVRAARRGGARAGGLAAGGGRPERQVEALPAMQVRRREDQWLPPHHMQVDGSAMDIHHGPMVVRVY